MPTSDFNQQESESSFNNHSESSESEKEFSGTVEYNINIKSSKGGTNHSKQHIAPVDQVKIFKRSQTKISKEEKDSMESQKKVRFMKKSVGNMSNHEDNTTLFSNKKAKFLNTRELKSRGSTENGIIVNPMSKNFNSNIKIMYQLGKSRQNKSLNLFKVAKQLHRSMDENIIDRMNQPGFMCEDQSQIKYESRELSNIIKKYRWKNSSVGPFRHKINNSINLLKMAKQASVGILNRPGRRDLNRTQAKKSMEMNYIIDF